MNNPTQQIKQMAKNLFKAKSDSSHVKVLHPKRDWSIGVVIAICIVCAITIWNGYTYFANRDGGSTDTEIEIANPRYQAELVDEALGLFDAKAVAFDSLSSGVQPSPSPAPVDADNETDVNSETNESASTTADVSTSADLSGSAATSSTNETEVAVPDTPAEDVQTESSDESVVPELSQ